MAKQHVAEQETLGEAMNRTELFFEKNGRNMAYIFLGLLVLAALIFGYRALIVAPRATKAAERIAEAQYRFEEQNPDYQLALEGDANGAGFLDVIEEYGSTPSGNLAKHYAGICYLKTGDLENAAKYLAKYSPVKGIPGALINAQNLGLQGDIAVEQQNYAKAVKFYEQAVKEYEKRLSRCCKLELLELPEQRLGDEPSEAEIRQTLKKEAALVEQKLSKGGALIAMCIEGQEMSSVALSQKMQQLAARGASQLTFLIGSSFGLDEDLKKKADLRLSMSPMTFPHHLARVMLLEQIYRAYQIEAGTKYHK